MNPKDATAYCGIYCLDCIHFRNRYSEYARQLKDELEQIEFDQYAAIDSPFGAQFGKYDAFKEVLKVLAETQCDKTCRVGGGCSGTPCEIMECCVSRNYEGCWECSETDECDKFDFLQPRCGEMPKNNIRKIHKHDIQNWADMRDKFYIWQK